MPQAQKFHFSRFPPRVNSSRSRRCLPPSCIVTQPVAFAIGKSIRPAIGAATCVNTAPETAASRRQKIVAPGTDRQRAELFGMVTIDILEKPIERIRETCELVGAVEKFERTLPELETYLEEEIARGETSETRLTYHGLCFLKDAFARQ